jgi:hypothetical protein
MPTAQEIFDAITDRMPPELASRLDFEEWTADWEDSIQAYDLAITIDTESEDDLCGVVEYLDDSYDCEIVIAEQTGVPLLFIGRSEDNAGYGVGTTGV